ncbi:MAG: ABC transporter ATP-binding protein/permease [Schwartzia sp.]|nr:ABC transporter ATP-binding protein/permease [Schwartzia sp. (in: firmicutes)]
MNSSLCRDFWHLFKGYWGSEKKKSACGLLTVVIALNFAMVYLLVLLNEWYNEFYNSLQAYDYDQFWPLIGKFAALAFLHIGIAVYAIYLRQLLELRWRTWMTERYLKDWLGGQAHYRLQVLGSDMDNPDQRIQEDIDLFVSLTLQLLLGILKQLTTLVAFAVVLWNLSGVLDVPIGDSTFHIYGYMLWFSLLYSAVGTALAHIVGRKLISLNFEQQRFEADFRFAMARMRENSESIAFYRGEDAENVGFLNRFALVIKNFRELMRQTKFLNFYANSYMQLAIIAPIILAAPRYFSGAMQLGGLMQTISAFGRVQDALSYFVEVYDTIARLIAVIHRLAGFTAHLEEVRALAPAVEQVEGGDAPQGFSFPSAVAVDTSRAMILDHISVSLPDGRELLHDCSLLLPAGKRLLVTGPSGCGKSTLLRTLAGIWPFGGGRLIRPEKSRVLFLPQRPYLPLGTLRRAIAYPLADPESLGDARVKEVLALVDLPELADRLDTTDDWSRILSLGEQQRIAFARVVLLRPDWVFLDEATSALDEARESRLYDLLKEELPDAGIVSVAHRTSLFARHDTELHLGDVKATLRPIEH